MEFDKVWDNVLKRSNWREMIDSHSKTHALFHEMLLNLISKIEKKDPVRILEVGCGSAIDSFIIASRTKVDAYAIDLSNSAVQTATEIGKHFNNKVNLKVADINNSGFEKGHFDIIFSQGVMEHFTDPLSPILSQKQLLNDNGYLVIDVPQKYNLYTIYRYVLQLIGKWPYGWERSYSFYELKVLARKTGLEVIDKYTYGMSCELSRSKRPYISIVGKIYDFIVAHCHKQFPNLMQDICVVFVKEKNNAN